MTDAEIDIENTEIDAEYIVKELSDIKNTVKELKEQLSKKSEESKENKESKDTVCADGPKDTISADELKELVGCCGTEGVCESEGHCPVNISGIIENTKCPYSSGKSGMCPYLSQMYKDNTQNTSLWSDEFVPMSCNSSMSSSPLSSPMSLISNVFGDIFFVIIFFIVIYLFSRMNY
jgi:hypothetical protein